MRSGPEFAPLSTSVPRFKAIRSAVTTRVLACVVAGALLLFELLAANGAFHQALHHSGRTAATTCVLCLFAKGQLDSSEPGPISTEPFLIPLCPEPTVETIVVTDFTYLSSPSRAPPVFSSLLSVVA